MNIYMIRCSRKLLNILPSIYADRVISLYRFVRFHKRVPNLYNPKRMTDIILKKRLLWSPNEEFEIITADKYKVRSYISEIVGCQYLTKLYGSYNCIDEIEFDKLTYPCVFKSTHGTNHVIILKSKDEMDETLIRKIMASWLIQQFPHWYRHIKPRIICEEFLGNARGQSVEDSVPEDYKYFVFDGKVKFISVQLDRFKGEKRSLYTRDWNPIDVTYRYPKGGFITKPTVLNETIDIAEKLSVNRDFLRVDLYILGDRIVIGELTHSPNAGNMRFYPDSFDFYISL